MNTPDFDGSAAACRAGIEAGTLHPASLADLARNRLRRIAEARDATGDSGSWRDQHDSAEAAARAVLAEGLAGAAAHNASRAA